MKSRNGLISRILGMLLLCANAAYATEAAIIGNLTETSDKISSIDMGKNFSEAGNALNTFYTGAKDKVESASPTVYMKTSSPQRTLAQAEKELCNAKSAKIKVLPSKVAPLGNETIPARNSKAGLTSLSNEEKYTWHGPNPNPSNDPEIENGLNQHYQSWCNAHPTANACNPSNPYSPSYTPTQPNNSPSYVSPSAGTVTCNSGQCGLP